MDSKKLAHVIMEAEKSPDLQMAGWRASGVSSGPKAEEDSVLAQRQTERKNSFLPNLLFYSSLQQMG